MTDKLLEVRGLHASYDREGHVLPVLRGVDLSLEAGRAVALVGRSGCGKSTLARCLLGLHPLDAGSIVLGGRDISRASERVWRSLRRHLQFVFQVPRAAVDPLQRVDAIVGEPLAALGLVSRRARPGRVARLLDRVGLDASLGDRYPHELSGGQLQRVCIARAIATGPRLLIADEPTSSLDLIAQARILQLLAGLRDEGLALLFITHDLRLVPSLCDDVVVMGEGVIVERRSAQDLAGATAQETRALLAALEAFSVSEER